MGQYWIGADTYRDGADSDLLDMAEHMFRSIADPPSTNRRITGEKGSRGLVKSALFSRRTNRCALSRGQSLVIGNVGDAHTQRAYIKENDRARFENTLTGDALPFNTLDQWQRFRFESLAELFRWRRFPKAGGLLGVLRDWFPAIASPPSAKSRQGHRRTNKRGSVADRGLSDAARVALRRLSTAQGERMR